MPVTVARHSGFCSGVKRAVAIAEQNAAPGVYVLGELIHNPDVVKRLEQKGLVTAESVEEVPDGATLIIRSHGVAEAVIRRAEQKGLKVLDATCPSVRRIHEIVRKYYAEGYKIVIVGEAGHPEVVGINGWCNGEAYVLNSVPQSALPLNGAEKVCIVCQTTFSEEIFGKIKKNILLDGVKTLEVFNTICYTTKERNKETAFLAQKSDCVIVLGGRNSANTRKLFELSSRSCSHVYWVESLRELELERLKKFQNVSIVAGASTPIELIKEVKLAMSEIIKEANEVAAEEVTTNETASQPIASEAPVEVVAEEAKKGPMTMEDVLQDIDKQKKNLRRGQVMKAVIVAVNDDGVALQLGAKKEFVLSKAEATLDEEFNAANFVIGEELEVVCTGTEPFSVSRKALLLSQIEAEKISGLTDGEEFTVKVDGHNKGGLTAKFGSYSVFIPASQIRIGYVKTEDLPKYVGKELRLKALKIERKNITGSCRPIIEAERAIRDAERKKLVDEFFSTIEVGHVVEGKVARFAAFGAFVNVNGFDCLAHISDLAWTNVRKAEDVLEKDKVYEFVVLKIDKENQRVSIGYKQLQPKPWTLAAEKYPAGSVIKGKVVRIASFGAFVEVEPGIDGLVHVSQISHEWIENPTSALKVGDEIDVKVLDIKPEEEKLTLSIKALVEAPERPERRPREEAEEGAEARHSDRIQRFERRERSGEQQRAERRERRPRNTDDGPHEFIADSGMGASIGELLKDAGLNLDETTED